MHFNWIVILIFLEFSCSAFCLNSLGRSPFYGDTPLSVPAQNIPPELLEGVFLDDACPRLISDERLNERLVLMGLHMEYFKKLHYENNKGSLHNISAEVTQCSECMEYLRKYIHTHEDLLKKTPGRDKKTWSELFLLRSAKEDVEVYPSRKPYKTWIREGCRNDSSIFNSTLLYTGDLCDEVTFGRLKMARVRAQVWWEEKEKEKVSIAFSQYDKKKKDSDTFWKGILNPPVTGRTFKTEPYIYERPQPFMEGDVGDPAQCRDSNNSLSDAIQATGHAASWSGSSKTYWVRILGGLSCCADHNISKSHAIELIRYINNGHYRGPLKPQID